MEEMEREALRYLGYRDAKADERILEHIRQMSAQLKPLVSMGNVFGIWDVQLNPPLVTIEGMTADSKDLAAHLKGCTQVVLMAATLGTGADELIRRYSVSNMELAVVAQAVCAAEIEAYCDKVQDEIVQNVSHQGLFLTTRFSPGYGDFAIEHQGDILRLLNCGRRIGLTMSDEYMLIPSKSVTAVIGLSPEKRCAEGKCNGCVNEHCEFRKENG